MKHLFTYGTLMDSEFWESIATQGYESVPITLHGVERRAIKNRHYPGIIINKSKSVDGILYLDISDADFKYLDEYEGEEYERITVTLKDFGEAECYLYVGPADQLDGDWPL